MKHLKNLLRTKLPNLETCSNSSVFLYLFLISLCIRLPFFFRDYIDRDESTFILLGQSWVDGHLPYTELWDLKPPLAFLFFAGLIYLFGKSFVAIRMAGVLAVAITSYFTYALGRDLVSRKAGFRAGVACIFLLSLFGSLQGLMSEHLCMLYFMPALYLMAKKRNAARMLLAGLLMGMTLMTKLNLGYAAVLLGIYLLFDGFRNRQYGRALLEASAYASGAGFVIALTWLPYAYGGEALLWWNSVIMAPLEYASVNRQSIGSTLPVVLLTIIFLVLGSRKKWLRLREPAIQVLSVAIIGVLLSFLQGGRVNGHYLIQFHPVFLVLLAIVLSKALPTPTKLWGNLLLLLPFLLPVESYMEYVEPCLGEAQHRHEVKHSAH